MVKCGLLTTEPVKICQWSTSIVCVNKRVWVGNRLLTTVLAVHKNKNHGLETHFIVKDSTNPAKQRSTCGSEHEDAVKPLHATMDYTKSHMPIAFPYPPTGYDLHFLVSTPP